MTGVCTPPMLMLHELIHVSALLDETGEMLEKLVSNVGYHGSRSDDPTGIKSKRSSSSSFSPSTLVMVVGARAQLHHNLIDRKSVV